MLIELFSPAVTAEALRVFLQH